MILMFYKIVIYNNYLYLFILVDNFLLIGREIFRVDGFVLFVDRKFFCIYIY